MLLHNIGSEHFIIIRSPHVLPLPRIKHGTNSAFASKDPAGFCDEFGSQLIVLPLELREVYAVNAFDVHRQLGA